MLTPRTKQLFALLTAVLILFSCLPAHAMSTGDVQVQSLQLKTNSAPENGMVRVYLSSMGNPSTLNLTTSGSYLINGEKSRSIPSGSALTVSFNASSGALTLAQGGATYQMGSYFILRRTSTDSSNHIKIKQVKESNNPYPGDLSFRAVKQSSGKYKLYTIAHVYLENYLYGVVPYEMGNSSSIEALKAQAVAARSYTVRKMHLQASGYYDVVDTSGDQVYRGTPSGNANCVAAVDATKGIVLKYNGKDVLTYFSSSNGGQTESVQNVNGNTSYPYLKVKDDPFDYNNSSSKVTSKTIYADLKNSANPSAFLSSLKTKTVAALKAKGHSATASNTTLLTLKSVTPHTPKYPSPSRLYTKMDFTLTAKTGSNGASSTVTVTFDIFKELESAFSMSIQSASNELWSVKKSGNTFVFEARRYGHGYGMSQRGAMQMGKLGYTYDQILGFYYEGCNRLRQSFTHTFLNPESGMDEVQVQKPSDQIESFIDDCYGVVKLVSNQGILAIRKEKSNTAAMVGVAENGVKVYVINDDGKWCYISYGAIKGYVPSASLSITGSPYGKAGSATSIQGFARVSCNQYLNLRAEPSKSAKKLGSVPDGSVVTVFSVSGSWAHVQYGSIVAYVNTPYISAVSSNYPDPVSAPAGIVAVVTTENGTGSVNLMDSASVSGTVLSKIPVSQKVTVLADDGAWSKIRSGSLEGYMLSKYLSYSSSGEVSTQPPSTSQTMLAKVTTPSGSLNLRSAASLGSRVVITIPRDEIVTITSYGQEWCAVTYGEYQGYAMTSFLTLQDQSTPTTPQTPSQQLYMLAVVTTASGSLNLREQPKSGSRILCTIPRNEEVQVISSGSEWCNVKYNGVTGYVMTTFLRFVTTSVELPDTDKPSAPDAGKAVVNTTSGSLNLREQPKSGATILVRIPQYTEIDVLEKGGNWTKVRFHVFEGYVVTSYLSFGQAPSSGTEQDNDTARVTTPGGSLNLRSEPKSGAGILLRIPENAIVQVINRSNSWCKVSYMGIEGYVMTSFLSFSPSAVTEQPVTIEPVSTPQPVTATPVKPTVTPAPQTTQTPTPAPTSVPQETQTTTPAPTSVPQTTPEQLPENDVEIESTDIPETNDTEEPEDTPVTETAEEPVEEPVTEIAEESVETLVTEIVEVAEESPVTETTEEPVESFSTETPQEPAVTSVPETPVPEQTDELSTKMETLAVKENALLMSLKGEKCALYADCSLTSEVVEYLAAKTPVIIWLKGKDWCLVQYDMEDTTKLAYCLTKDLRLTGE